MSSIYFSHCWGVFEGGGVRASAHAGAFAAAREAGIVFGRVAGTSGGSIVAALVAAGASPKYISDQLQQTDLSQFLRAADPSDSVFTERPTKLVVFRRLAWGKPKIFANVALDSGLYSSKPLQEWLEAHLRYLIEPRRAVGVVGSVRFAELPLPLHVVATDLTTGRPKVWSREATPEDSVALAVRCSCSIPFFYQAVENHQSVLVDGGAVSNLPSFVYTGLIDSEQGRSVLSRVLAFRLVEDARNTQGISNLVDFASKLSNAVIGGSSHIQSTLQPSVYDVVIRTGSIKSTDFDGVKEKEKKLLHDAGEAAVRDFVKNERAIVQSSNRPLLFRGFDEKMLLLVQSLQSCEKVFLAIGESAYWMDFVFPTVLSVARRGVQIICVTTKPNQLDEERRLSLLFRLGAEIVYLESGVKLPFEGFVFDVQTDNASAILSTLEGETNRYLNELVRTYSVHSDPAVLEMLTEKLAKHWSRKAVAPRSLPYGRCSELDLFEKLQTVRQYAQARFRLTDVAVDDQILVLQEAVKEFKILQIKQHMQDLKKHDCDFFEVRQVELNNGTGTIVTPPVLERLSGDQLVLLEGNTRFFHCLATGVKTVRAVIVEGVEARLPAQHPKPLSSLRLTSSTTSLVDNYRHVDKSLFRRIEEAVHPYTPTSGDAAIGKNSY